MNWRVKFRLFQAATYGIVFAVIALMTVITGKYIETIGLFISFVALRNEFGKTWHSKSFWYCIFISCLIFVVTIGFVPDKNFSILACIIFGLLIDYIAYKYRDYEDIRFQLVKPFNVETCTTDELLTRCREVGLSKENTELAIEFFIKKTKQSEIASLLCIEEHAVSTRKLRLKKKLNKN
jgi:hypothetical protein